MSKPLEKLPNTIWVLAAGLLCVGAGQSIVFITIPPIARDLGLNEIQIGSISVSYTHLTLPTTPYV